MLNIRAATAEDSAALLLLVNSAYRGVSASAGWTNESAILVGSRTSDEHLRKLIASPKDVVLVAVKDQDELIGCVHLEQKTETTTYLGMLTTHPLAQGSGIGSKLIAAGEEYARREWRARQIEMTVIDVRLELIAYYVRRGYSVTGEKRPFPDDPVNGRSLIGPLTFDVLVKNL